MNREEILKEQYFPAENMDYAERDYLLELLSNCKDICDSEHGLNRSGTIIELYMRKLKKDIIRISGSISYGSENRVIEGYIYYEKKKIVFDAHMIRLCVTEGRKEYMVLDIFNPIKDGFKRTSNYNYDIKEYVETINMKGNKYGKN